MKQLLIFCISILSAAQVGIARTWTSTQGKEVEATIVQLNPDRTVALRTDKGKVVKVPFDAFIEEDLKELDYLLSLPFKPHPVTWQEMNALFGMNIWGDALLFDDPTHETAARMQLELESETAFMENYRAYPLGEQKILTEPAFTSVLYGAEKRADSISFVFLNQGDIDLPPGSINSQGHISPDLAEDITEKIEACGMRIQDVLEHVLGEPKRDLLGTGTLREKVWRWDWNSHAIMLTMQDGKYVAMRIMPADRADRAGRMEKLKSNELKKRMATCVERRDNGDVVINNIPMIDQGPKGYCSPATWERYLRYIGIPADMYLLALAAGTGVGGGTSSRAMSGATGDLLASHGRDREPVSESITPANIAEYIDQGLPIMWRLLSTPSFQIEATVNTAKRNGREINIKRNNSGQSEDNRENGHICLIIGYNKQTGEIAISDSWGPKFAERWVKASTAQSVTNPYDSMNVIKW